MFVGYDDVHWNSWRIEGTEALNFLHRTLAQDLKGLTPGKAVPFAMTDRLGMLQNYGYLRLVTQDKIELVYQDVVEQLVSTLDQLRVMEDVHWKSPIPCTTTFVWNQDLAQKTDLTALRSDLFETVPFRKGCPVSLVFHSEDWTNTSIKLVSDEVWELKRYRTGIPRKGHELIERRIPFEVGLGDFVSVNKGCYIGQETLTKYAHRAEFPRRLCSLTSVPATATLVREVFRSDHLKLIRNAEPLPVTITSGTFDDSMQIQMLAICPRQLMESHPPDDFQIEIANGVRLPVTRTELFS